MAPWKFSNRKAHRQAAVDASPDDDYVLTEFRQHVYINLIGVRPPRWPSGEASTSSAMDQGLALCFRLLSHSSSVKTGTLYWLL